MTTFDQELTGRHPAAGADLDARRVARAVVVRDTTRTLHVADERRAPDLADDESPAAGVDDAEGHLDHIANDVSHRSVMAPPTTGGDTA